MSSPTLKQTPQISVRALINPIHKNKLRERQIHLLWHSLTGCPPLSTMCHVIHLGTTAAISKIPLGLQPPAMATSYPSETTALIAPE